MGRIDDDANVYFTVAAFRQNDRGEWRRRKDQFAGGILLMIDDLGDGPGSKFQLSKIDELPPTALIETSPGNFQAIYMFYFQFIPSLLKFINLTSWIATGFILVLVLNFLFGRVYCSFLCPPGTIGSGRARLVRTAGLDGPRRVFQTQEAGQT